MNLENIAKNLAEIQEDIEKYSKKPEAVKLVVASKYVDSDGVKKIFDAGHKIMGENRIQSLKEKKENLSLEEKYNGVSWHFIGNLQKNKVKYIIDYIDMIHSVNKLSLAKEINKRAAAVSRVVDVLLEVNVGGEESKEGYTVQELLAELEELKKMENLNIKGLMTMAPFTENEEVVRECFRNLRKLKDRLNEDYFDGKLTELSMGMTNDYKIALEEGATIIRVGSKIFS